MDNNLMNLLVDFLDEEGYRHRETDFGLEFKSNGLTILFIRSDTDSQIFQLVLPDIYDVDDDNEYAVLQAANKVSYGYKVIKVFVTRSRTVDVSFQILADSTPEIKEFMPRAIAMLEQARAEFYRNLGI